MRAARTRWIVGGLGGLLVVGLVASLFFFGIVRFNNPPSSRYPVRGVDVSSYQGPIDWTTLSRQGIAFAFIKATEGSGYEDERFQANLAAARTAGLRVGAYHFFSFESGGASQASNFESVVPIFDDMLPPVVDLELYGQNDPPDPVAVSRELTILLAELADHYGQQPIIYATEQSYRLYLAGSFPDYDIWIRNVLTSPGLPDGRTWTFWQYTSREHLSGYSGQRYIDMNVFNGTAAEFASYGR